ncbi:MAG: PD-(D/E)XK nuclease family protein [Mediterranea massiliensis]|nr:PD-(D/E)XK nuclease family protein [Mediterranea massiliensis]
MKTFLESVAEDLYNKIGNNLSHTAVVFPNKRAALFFNEHLAAQSERPLWSPAYVSISELFRKLSPWKAGDPIRLVCELHQVFCQETGSTETLDDFYFWGELLISDFDDVDKNMVEADRLFSNLQELKNIGNDYRFIEKEQEEALQQFFKNFSIEKRTKLKEKFISLWDKLGDIYRHYRRNLASQGIAYEGMMYRHVMEQLDVDRLPYERYVFVGFNVLNKVETSLFEKLQAAEKALFYWDYDHYYTTRPIESARPYSHEAGEFLLRNLKKFPNELPATAFDAMRQPKQIRFISSPTENGQARYLTQWIKELNKEEIGKETAVVLCNEALLLPVLHSIPSEVKNTNITMGFPLAQTPVYNFVNALAELYTSGYNPREGRFDHKIVLTILKHPYTRQLSPFAEPLEQELISKNRFYPLPSELKRDDFLEQIFTPQENIREICLRLGNLLRDVSALYRNENKSEREEMFSQLYRESLFKTYTVVTRLQSLIETGILKDIRTETFKRLLNRLLNSSNIPFHGEPAIGMQVMGVLETRNLDFDNLLMLSLNEGQLPKNEGDSSFVPYNLRKAFGMTTVEHKNSVYAYYFYRLIQRAQNITLLYNTSCDGLNRGEMSRFMLQLQAESPHSISSHFLEAEVTPLRQREISIPNNEETKKKLRETFDTRLHPQRLLSPSALNTYLDCRLKFYYQHVARISAPEEVDANINSALFGTIFHRSAELAYEELTKHGKKIRKEDIEQLLKNEIKLQAYVDQAFKEHFFKIEKDEKAEYNGTQLIHSKVITYYLKQLLRNDCQYAPFNMVGMEQRISENLEIDTPEGKIPIKIGGVIDRMDSKEDTLRIVDYKTGGIPKSPESIEQLFTPAAERPGYIFQTFLYAAIVSRKQSLKVAPSLLYIHRAASETYSPVIEIGPAKQKMEVNNFAFYEDKFRKMLHQLLNEIFNGSTPFSQTEEVKQCEYCDFRTLCRR